MKPKRQPYSDSDPTTLIGQLGAEAAIEAAKEDLLIAARIKVERRLFAEFRKGRKSGKIGRRWERLEAIKVAENLGCAVRLDSDYVREALEDAIQANDWKFLYLLARWHEKERKPTKPDALAEFMVEGWKRCLLAKDGWKGLRDLDDQGIAVLAKKKKISNRAFKKGDLDGARAVTERRLMLQLARSRDPLFTFRVSKGELVLKRLAQ